MPRQLQDKAEISAEEWLRSQGYSDVRRPFGDPPDFVVENRYAVEVTRLMQRITVGDDKHTQSEYETSKPLTDCIRVVLEKLGPPGNRGKSWVIDCEYDFSKPLPKAKTVRSQLTTMLKPLLKPYDENILASIFSRHFDYDKHASEAHLLERPHLCLDCGICLSLGEFSCSPERFILQNVSNDKGVGLAEELRKGVQHIIGEKSRKIRNQNKTYEYEDWWLILMDYVCYLPIQILSENELSFIQDQGFDFWSRIVIVSSQNLEWHYDLLDNTDRTGHAGQHGAGGNGGTPGMHDARRMARTGPKGPAPRRFSRLALACACLGAVALPACTAAMPEATGGGAGRMPPFPVPGTAGAERVPSLPPIPFADGDVSLEVGYPAEGAALAVRDRNFLFGSTGSGRARLTVNGAPVEVAPNGGFLAFLPVPPDGVYRLVAERDGVTATFERTVRLPPSPSPPLEGLAIMAGSGYPSGSSAAGPGEPIEVGFRGTPGGDAWLVFSGGDRVRLVEAGALDAAADTGGALVAQRPEARPAPQRATVRYEGVLPARAVVAADAEVPRPTVGGLPPEAEGARFELILGADTVRTPLRLNLAILSPERPRVAAAFPPPDAPSEWRVRGRNDVAGPYHFFWPEGTVLKITGERDGMLRVGLAPNRSAWVPAGEVHLLAEGTPPPSTFVGDVRLYPEPGHIDVRIPLPERLPFQVVAEERVLHLEVFGAVSRTNFFQYGQMDPLVERAEWSQPSDQVYRVSVRLNAPVWGYEAFFDASGAVVLRIRRPPGIDPSAPLRGLRVVVDPGHGGAYRATRGPTGLAEADANLAVSLALRDFLEERGADVILTRTGDETVELADRPRIAVDAGGDLLVSVHNNAFPDGVDPRANHGTSVYYFHPPSAELARLLQQELLEELGTRDLGIERADLAVVRPSWMPSILSEALFMMIPEQEAALRDPDVQRRIALAHVRALEAFAARRSGFPAR